MHRRAQFPVLRWIALLWLAVWIPVMVRAYGWVNFLHECDVAVILTAIGFWYPNALLFSSQLVGALVPDILWCLDAFWRLFSGHNLIGGTEYMWDSSVSLIARLSSLYHVALPVLLIWAVLRTGYDRRAAWTQMGIFGALLVASRFAPADLNLNFAYLDPLFHRSWGAAPEHLAVIMAGALVAFFPAHWIFCRYLPAAENHGA